MRGKNSFTAELQKSMHARLLRQIKRLERLATSSQSYTAMLGETIRINRSITDIKNLAVVRKFADTDRKEP